MTRAEMISAHFGDDGQRFRDRKGIEIQAVLRAAGAFEEWRDGRGTDVIRYTLPDGSVITVAGDAWDLGYPGCYCWQGVGHDDDCA